MPMMNLDFLSNDYQEKKTKAQKIEEEIKIEILSGRLRTGQRIVEQDLCDKYGISRTPIREAIRKLDAAGVLEKQPEKLRQTAQMRMQFPELTLSELAEEFHPPLTKSCLNHRLRKLVELGKKLDEKEKEKENAEDESV